MIHYLHEGQRDHYKAMHDLGRVFDLRSPHPFSRQRTYFGRRKREVTPVLKISDKKMKSCKGFVKSFEREEKNIIN